MMRSMYSGVAGLKVHQTKMDVIGNNISNVNTVGYKGSRATFKEMFSQTLKGASAPQNGRGGINPQQVGLGVSLGSIDTNMESGNLQPTGKSTDLALQGNGFFVVSDGSQKFYTRAGSFSFDEEGYLAAPNGFRVQGWLANETGDITVDPQNLENLNLDESMTPSKSTFIDYNGNLDSSIENNLSLTPSKLRVKDNVTSATDTINVDLSKTNNFNQWKYTLDADNSASAFEGLLGIDSNTINVKDSVTGDTASINVNMTKTSNFNEWRFDLASTDAASITNDEIYLTLNNDGTVKSVKDAGGASVNQVTVNDPGDNGGTDSVKIKLPASGDDLTSTPLFRDDGSGEVQNSINGTYTENNVGYITLDENGIISAINSKKDGSGADLTQALNTNPSLDIGGVGDTVDINIPGIGQNIDNVSLFKGTEALQESIDGDYKLNTQRKVTTDIYDSQGKVHTVSLTATKINDNSWQLSVDDVSKATNINLASTPHILNFNDKGELTSGDSVDLTFDPDALNNSQTVSLDFSQLTQFDGEMTVDDDTYDGYSAGSLQSFSIGESGIITGSYDNGYNKQLAQIAVGNCSNPAGMKRVGDTMFQESNNSGGIAIDAPGVNGRGSISASSLEMSNVDLAQQFTEMITAQRGFQANSKIISTSDQMLQELVNLKR